MIREEILEKIKDLGITIEENKIEDFRQLFEDRDVLESALITDWTLYRYVPEELQNDPEIIRLTTQGMPESLFYDENYASRYEGIYDESKEAMDSKKDSSRKRTSRKTDDQGSDASGPSNDSNEHSDESLANGNNQPTNSMSPEVQLLHEAVMNSEIYDDNEKMTINEILFQIDNSNLTAERKEYYIRELREIMFNYDMNRRDRFASEEEFYSVRNENDHRLVDLLRSFREEDYQNGRNRVSSNIDLNVAKRELENYFRRLGDRSFRISVHSDEEILQIYNNLLNRGGLNSNNIGNDSNHEAENLNDVTNEINEQSAISINAQDFYDAVENSEIYDNNEKMTMNEILFQIVDGNLTAERKEFFIRELREIMFNYDMNRRDRFASEEEFYSVRNENDHRLVDLLNTVNNESYQNGKNRVSSNTDLNVAKREVEKYFRDLGVRSFKISVHSDEEILQIYNNLLNSGSLNYNDSNENDYGRNSGFGGNNGTGNNGGNGGDSGAGSTGNGNIDYEIEEFKNHYDELLGDINKLRASLVLGTGLESLNINNEIIKLGKELKELDREANELISDIDEFRKNAFGENPSMTVPEIKASMKNIKDRLLELKKSQIEKYNSRVNEINTKIDELKALTDVPENVANMINNLNKLNLCDDITTYKDVNYLDKTNYDDMVDRYNRINEIEKELGRERKPDSINFELDSDIHHIEEEIARVNYYISDTMTRDAINSLNQSIIGISVSITEFKAKLEQNKDKLSLDDYRVYLEIIDEDELILNDLADKLSKIKDVDKENTVYQDFLTRLNNLSKYASSLENLVDALKGNIFENTVDIFKSKIVGARSSLNRIKAEIEQAYNEGKLDNVQYNNLNNKINEIEEVINRAGYKLLDPEMVLSGDTFSLINGNIDRLEDEIIILENRVNELQKPIKDRKVKKEIDNTIANLEREIKVIRSILKDHKDEDEDKYQASVDRLNQLEDRLSQVGKKYRSKCPLRVKSVKSAKAFYKKHKKPILIAAGIAALAVELAVGPVIIPAIIKGNLLLKDKLPFGKSAFVGINNVLAGLINAKSKAGIIIKSSGEVINIGKNVNLCTSLLKGVALSGLGTAAIVAPVVGSIKALMEKMKQKELKKQMSHPQNNIRLSDDNKNILFDEYKKFNRSAEEFVEFYGLDQKFIEILNNLDNERTLEEEDTDRRAR